MQTLVRRKLSSITLFLCLVVLASGWACQAKDDIVRKAARASEGASIAVRTFQEEEIKLYQQKLVTDADHRVVQEGLIKVATIGKQVDEGLRGANNSVDAKSTLQNALRGIAAIETQILPRLKNEDLRVKFYIALVGVRTSLSSIEAML